ncbi:MAG: biotin transporter BioY [Candidatus Pelagibacterales bacterium]|jgi:biotin transport system substrate-specific component|tara:strand:+ start:560 stop:1159 length:600 start_codon:yes stop_codon:yes gene_type:complete
MTHSNSTNLLTEALWRPKEKIIWLQRAILVALGIVFLIVTAKIKLVLPFSPVPITMGTFAVLTIGTTYGQRLGLTTVFGYLLIGMLGFDVFANSSAEANGISYMFGGTGGYLIGYCFAVIALGYFAKLNWDRNIFKLGVALFVANVLIYAPGLLWLGQLYGWDQPIIAWGLTPFIVGDLLKLALTASLIPLIWKLISKT